MHITDYEKVKDLVANNVFLLDGPNGTQSILAADLLAALSKITPTSDLTDNIHLDEILQANRIELPDRFLIEADLDKKVRSISANDLYFCLTDAIGLNAKYSCFRKKNLGSVFSDSQKEAISNGSYRGLFLGDYWRIGGFRWEIVDFDYANDRHLPNINHIAIVPSAPLYYDKMETSIDNYNNGYGNSYMHTTGLTPAKNIIKGAFGEENIMPLTEMIVTKTTSTGITLANRIETGLVCEIPKIMHFFGTSPRQYGSDPNGYPWDTDCGLSAQGQFAYFKVNKHVAFQYEWVGENGAYWMRDQAGANGYVVGYGCNSEVCTAIVGVRPYFLLSTKYALEHPVYEEQEVN